MALRPLILLNVIHQHLQPAVDASMVQIEPEAPHFHRLTAALMLPQIDARVQLLQHLIIAREERFVEDFRIAHVDSRFQRLSGNHDALRQRFKRRKLKIH